MIRVELHAHTADDPEDRVPYTAQDLIGKYSRDAGEFMFLLAPDASLDLPIAAGAIGDRRRLRAAIDEPWLLQAQAGILADVAAEYRERLRDWCDELGRATAPETIARIEKWVKAGARYDLTDTTVLLDKVAPSPDSVRRAALEKMSPEERDKVGHRVSLLFPIRQACKRRGIDNSIKLLYHGTEVTIKVSQCP